MKCLVCKAPGQAVPVLGGVRLGACSKHEQTVRTGLAVSGAVTKAGIIAAMEMKRPGLYQELGELYWKVRAVFGSGGSSSSQEKKG